MKYYVDKQILILGGFGYVGPSLVKRLVNLGAQVTVVARNAEHGSDKHAKYPELYKIANVVSFDPLVDFEPLQEHLNKTDIILNLIHAEKNDLTYQQNIVTLNFKLLQYCQENDLNTILVHFGSRLEYSKNCKLPIKEDAMLELTSVYGFAKLMSEKYYQFFNQRFGLKTICLRISNVYGCIECVPLKKNTVDALIYSALHDTIKIDHDPDRYKDFVYIDDFIDVLLLTIKNESCYGKTFNIGGDEKISLKNLAEKIKKLFNPQKEIVVLETVNKDDLSFLLDISAIKEANKWEPKINIDEGLQRIKKQLDAKGL
tara:strand:+ start:18254 stop:19198 length:945 start_codon:yes stop_codon:yes gene_type:complete